MRSSVSSRARWRKAPPHSGVARPVGTAFVLAGGGSFGAIEVGMLEALLAEGIAPDLVVGASVGAINGVYLASDPTVNGIRSLADIWHGLSREEVFPLSILRAGLALAGRRDSLLDPGPLARLLARHLPVQRLEETRIPCAVIATDALSGGEVVLTSGSAVEALLASAAIPALFPPVEHRGQFLIDGGVSNNTPISAAVEFGAQRIVVLTTGFSCAAPRPPSGVIPMVLHAFNLLVARQLTADIERLSHRADIVVVPPLCPLALSSYDFRHAAELIARGSASTQTWLMTGGMARSGEIPVRLLPHEHSSPDGDWPAISLNDVGHAEPGRG